MSRARLSASMVQANLGVSIVPDLTVKPNDSVSVKRLDLGPDAPKRTLGFVHLENQIKMQAINDVFFAFLSVIQYARAETKDLAR